MMIQNIQQEHEDQVNKLHQDFDEQIQVFVDAEKIIK